MELKTTIWVWVALALPAAPLWGDPLTPQQRGRAIAEEADRRHRGFVDTTANLRMILRNKQGQTSERELRIRALEVSDDGTKSLCIFDTPRDIKGTILLTHTHKSADDDQWLFLPALRRVRRIAARNKSGSFMGSEYAYEDIAIQELEKYTYKWVRDDLYDGNDCFVLERRPVDQANSGYSRQVVWIGKAEYRTWKVEYYDRKGDLLKTLTCQGYHKYADRFWRARETNMTNHQTGKSTQLIWSDFAFDTGQNKLDFERSRLTLLR
ncbi:MAG: outer membrane lipoprotein-sorting protein [Phycisphaerales bacterium]|nr:MAG: outer membrane lipoprotein-sorting protein [Phycisphaerales bacterium]